MTENDLVLNGFESLGDECYVYTKAIMGSYWPKKIRVGECIYQYEGNWPMPRDVAHVYLGHARFLRIKEEA